MKRLWILAPILVVLGCPPPAYVDIFNNTDAALRIQTPDGPLVLEPGQSLKREWRSLFTRWVNLDSDGNLWPILELEFLGRVAEYRYRPGMDEEWVHRYGGVHTAFVQVDLDLTVRIVKPDDRRPVSSEYAQPIDWPLRPLASAWIDDETFVN